MPEYKADSNLTAEGFTAWDCDPQDGNRPLKLRIGVYAGGKGDDRKTWWINVKFFPDSFNGDHTDLPKGTRVRISDARVDGLWTDKNGNPQIDFLAQRVEVVPREGMKTTQVRPVTPYQNQTHNDDPVESF